MFFKRENLKSLQLASFLKRFLGGFFTLSNREKIFLGGFVFLGFFGAILFSTRFYFANTEIAPDYGGSYVEGIFEPPSYVNPIVPDQNDVEESIENLVFSGLFRSDGLGGLQPDLAESLKEFEDGKTFLVTLKDDLYWHDNEPLTAQDIVFTIELLRNPELKNSLAGFWSSVSVDLLSEKSLKFTLTKPYAFFPDYLDFKILPKHLWQHVQPNAFVFSELNLQPIGSGPYKFKKMIQDKDGQVLQYNLVSFERYYLEGPFLENISFKLFQNQEEVLAAFKKKEINGFAVNRPEGTLPELGMKKVMIGSVFSLIFDNKNQLFSDLSLRKAISLAVDKDKIVTEAFGGNALKTGSLIPSEDFASSSLTIFDLDQAKSILAKAGWQDKDKDGYLEKRFSLKDKNPTKLEFSIIFQDLPEISKTAEILKNSLNQIGISLVLKPMAIGEFSSRLQSRSFQAVLLGQSLISARRPDFFPFWHSSETVSPGLNFANYQNKRVDEILEKIRLDRQKEDLFLELDQLIQEDYPGVFLAIPYLVWFSDDSFKIPSADFFETSGQRFARANEWHLYLKRVWKK